ncbi:vWA domain-containing protein [Pseudanabaena mucicola]|uniref:VWA domain-containing protein n=1 Tax=Pseudanabaena mucicola FACHB-723 TaxID=2692860 RepID=A0ABR7ZSD9_9CYAN|nr:vWA domain-containing protein [Pseudanabaena mucicola]MBD2186727.1 VWA domain-containing protein [Pseudanabaena mucicola FACHB-723]
MPYSAEISRRQPSCFLFLIDQSGSMADAFASNSASKGTSRGVNESLHKTNEPIQKAKAVADAVNRLLDSLGQRCVKGNEIYDYFDVGVIGYNSEVASALTAITGESAIAPIGKIYENPTELEKRAQRLPDGMGGLVEVYNDFPIWFKPVANGGTAMCSVFAMARILLEEWIEKHPNSYPPTIINITDGESTDGDPTEEATALKKLTTSDGAVLLYNIHLSAEYTQPVSFPSTVEVLSDPYAKLMFEISSPLPYSAQKAAEKEGYKIAPDARAFMFNADPVKLIQFLDIGTRTENLR